MSDPAAMSSSSSSRGARSWCEAEVVKELLEGLAAIAKKVAELRGRGYGICANKIHTYTVHAPEDTQRLHTSNEHHNLATTTVPRTQRKYYYYSCENCGTDSSSGGDTGDLSLH